MKNSTASTGEIYASALFSLVNENNVANDSTELGKAFRDLATARQIILENEGFAEFLSAPNINQKDKLNLLEQIFDPQKGISGFSQYVYNFIRLLTVKQRISNITKIYREFRKLYNDKFGITDVVATLPFAPDETARRKIKAKAEQLTGKTVSLEIKVDPALIGGIILDYNGQRLDGSVKTRLETLGNSIAEVIV